MHQLLRRVIAHKPVAISIVAVLVLAAAVPLASAVLVKPEPAKAQQGGPPGGGAGLVVRTAPVGVGPISSVLGYAGAVQSTQQVNVVARASGMLECLPWTI